MWQANHGDDPKSGQLTRGQRINRVLYHDRVERRTKKNKTLQHQKCSRPFRDLLWILSDDEEWVPALQILSAQTLIWFCFALTVVDKLNPGNCFCAVVVFFFVETNNKKKKPPANCLFSVWNQRYINRELWKHLRILKAKRICRQWRKELLWTLCLESEASSIVLCVFGRSCLRRSVYLHYNPSSFMAYRTTFRAKSSAASVRAKLTAYFMISMLSTIAQAALWRLFQMPDKRRSPYSILHVCTEMRLGCSQNTAKVLCWRNSRQPGQTGLFAFNEEKRSFHFSKMQRFKSRERY